MRVGAVVQRARVGGEQARSESTTGRPPSKPVNAANRARTAPSRARRRPSPPRSAPCPAPPPPPARCPASSVRYRSGRSASTRACIASAAPGQGTQFLHQYNQSSQPTLTCGPPESNSRQRQHAADRAQLRADRQVMRHRVVHRARGAAGQERVQRHHVAQLLLRAGTAQPPRRRARTRRPAPRSWPSPATGRLSSKGVCWSSELEIQEGNGGTAIEQHHRQQEAAERPDQRQRRPPPGPSPPRPGGRSAAHRPRQCRSPPSTAGPALPARRGRPDMPTPCRPSMPV